MIALQFSHFMAEDRYADPIDDLLVNIGGGLEGGVTVIDGVLGQVAKVTKRSD